MEDWYLENYLEIPWFGEMVFKADLRLICVLPQRSDPNSAETLANIIKACGLEAGVQTEELVVTTPVALLPTLGAKQTARIVSFGVSPLQLGLQHDCAPYCWLQIGGRDWCFAERLSVIAADMDRKKRLWACLKVLKLPG